MKIKVFMLGACAALAYTAALAQTQAQTAVPETAASSPAADAGTAPAVALSNVEVAGLKDPEWKPYAQMVKGVDAFAEYRQLAPEAALRFVLKPQGTAASLDGISARIESASETLALPVAVDGTFALPKVQSLLDDKAEIVLNRRKSEFRWRPHIRSPGVPDGQRRLGDLRLECQIRWAVEREAMGFLQRTSIVALGGPCATRFVSMLFPLDSPMTEMTLSAGGRTLQIPALAGRQAFYAPPLHDTSWPDDAVLVFQ